MSVPQKAVRLLMSGGISPARLQSENDDAIHGDCEGQQG
jgi:hypothetical protein